MGEQSNDLSESSITLIVVYSIVFCCVCLGGFFMIFRRVRKGPLWYDNKYNRQNSPQVQLYEHTNVYSPPRGGDYLKD